MGPSLPTTLYRSPSLPPSLYGVDAAPPPAYDDVPLRPLRPSRWSRQLSIEDMFLQPTPSRRPVLHTGVRGLRPQHRAFDLRWLFVYLTAPLIIGTAFGIVSGLRRTASKTQWVCLTNACVALMLRADPALQTANRSSHAWPGVCKNENELKSWAESGQPLGPCSGFPDESTTQFGALAAVIVGTFVGCTVVVLHQLVAVRRHNKKLEASYG